MPEITVHIEFPEPPPIVTRTARIVVEDVSTADLRATRVSDRRITPADPEELRSVTIDVPEPDLRASYSVRVHIDVDGSGAISAGDFVSTQSHPVLTRGHGTEVTVPVTRVD